MFIVPVAGFIVFLFFQSQGIAAGDSGDLVAAAASFGVSHPPGYPLYTFLGWLVNHLPYSTPAWRVGLLSSFVHAAVLYVAGLIVVRITASRRAALFTQCVLAANYLFFLYSVTPEVFALLDLFIVLFIWYTLEWVRSKSASSVYILFFLLGLSMTHHHLILFFIPGILAVFFVRRSSISFRWGKAAACALAGFIPYAYIVLPVLTGTSVIIWNPAYSIGNAVRLMTRADYGTFTSSNVIGHLPIQRLLNVQTYLQYITLDFLWIGVLLFLFGIWYLFRFRRAAGILIVYGLLSIGPVFYFYASFPLAYRFSLGTFERFLLPTYVLIALCIGIGYAWVNRLLLHAFRHRSTAPVISAGFGMLLFLYPLRIGSATIAKFDGYRADRTAEYVGIDILRTLPKNSILLVDRDTVLFTTQYVRYALNMRPDIAVLHGNKLIYADQRKIFSRAFPGIAFPDVDPFRYMPAFFAANMEKHTIFSYKTYETSVDARWVPYGLVYKLVDVDDVPTQEAYETEQMMLWEGMNNPAAGVLSTYHHLILSDVLDIYATARTEFAKSLLTQNRFIQANEQLKRAIAYGGDSSLSVAYMYKGISEILLKRCNDALSDFDSSRQASFSPVPELTYYRAVTYRDCTGDREKAAQLFAEYAKSVEKKKTPLESL